MRKIRSAGLFGESFAGQVNQPVFLVLRFEQVFDDFLFGFEAVPVAQSHAVDGDFEQLAFRYARRALLFAQEIFARLDEGVSVRGRRFPFPSPGRRGLPQRGTLHRTPHGAGSV